MIERTTATCSLALFGLLLLPAAAGHPAGNPAQAGEVRPTAPSPCHGAPEARMATAYRKPDAAQLKRRLTPLQYQVTQHEATERPFDNPYWDHHLPGLYVDIVTGEPLFSSLDKYDSGSGWPSFTRPLAPAGLVRREDHKLGVPRTEVRSAVGDSHLGHVFPDGPGPEGLRYCINSAALRFVPLDRLAVEGYGEYLALFAGAPSAGTGASMPAAPPVPGSDVRSSHPAPPGSEEAILAGGCFWGMEELIRAIPGVLATEVGYSGGSVPGATYPQVKAGTTGHAEAVRVLFDPARLRFEQLLDWYFRMHDPSTANRQGNDVGTQYRSAIFYTSEAQRESAQRVRARVDASGKWPRPLVTEIVAAGPFWLAEEYHQDYLQKNPDGYTCHFLRD